MTISEILDGAADWHEAHGWGQGTGGINFDGPCVNVAIKKVLGVRSAVGDTPPMMALRNALGAKSVCDVWRWNDAPGRTKAEVIALLRAVAISERARTDAPVVQPERERVE